MKGDVEMVNTMKEFQETLDGVVTKLIYAISNDFLNDEGVRTIEACRRLSEMVEFHDDFKTYAEDEEVKEVLKRFSDCKKIRNAKHFLDKKIKE